MNINLEGDLGSITQIDFENYLKTNYGIGNTMPMALPTFDYTKHNYPYCISYTIDNQLYYLFTCVFYDSFSKYKTYYLINTKATIEDADAPDIPTIYHIKSRYLKPISGIEKGIWTDWSTEDPYTYNFLLACGGVSSGDGSGSKITLKIWNSVTAFEKSSIDLTINKITPDILLANDSTFQMNMNELYLLEDSSVPIYVLRLTKTNSDGTVSVKDDIDLENQELEIFSYLKWLCKTNNQASAYAYFTLYMSDEDWQALSNYALDDYKQDHPNATDEEIAKQKEAIRQQIAQVQKQEYFNSLFLMEYSLINNKATATVISSSSSSGYGNVRADTSTYGECLEVYLPYIPQ